MRCALPAPINTNMHHIRYIVKLISLCVASSPGRGHASRLDRLGKGGRGTDAYAREEQCRDVQRLCCAELGIQSTVRDADYIGAWLEHLRGDVRAVFRAASLASKAADYRLAFHSSDVERPLKGAGI
jgi:antirestriction protein ArdC